MVLTPSRKLLDWEVVKGSLIERGLWDEDGIKRKARARHCKRCGAVVMAGLDHDRMALDVYCDPYPINALGEAVALLSDRRSYYLRWLGGEYNLDPRYSWDIEAHAAGSQPNIDVLVNHICGQELAVQYRGTELKARRRMGKAALNDDPPF